MTNIANPAAIRMESRDGLASARFSADSHLMLNGGDDEVCLESGDAVRGCRVDQFFALAPGQNGAYELAGNEIGKIARGDAAFSKHGRARPIASARFHSNRFKLHYLQFTPLGRQSRETAQLSTSPAGGSRFVYGVCSACDGKVRGYSTMKWVKRLLILIAVALFGAVAFSLAGIYLYRGTPKWYRPRIATTQQVKDAANRADQKLLDLFTWAASAGPNSFGESMEFPNTEFPWPAMLRSAPKLSASMMMKSIRSQRRGRARGKTRWMNGYPITSPMAE